MMEIEQMSCRKSYEVTFNVSISDLDKHYDGDDRLNYKNDGNVCKADENSFPLSITVEDDISSSYLGYDDYVVPVKKLFGIQVKRVSEMKCEADLQVTLILEENEYHASETIKFESNQFKVIENLDIGPNICYMKFSLQKQIMLLERYQYHNIKIKAIKGTVNIKFVPEIGLILKDRIVTNLGKSLDPMLSKEKSDEFELHCQNEVIIFHKPLLRTISDAFRNMLDNPHFKETQNGIMTIKETLPETIKAFKRIFYDNIIEEKDLNVDLMLFANQYNIKILVDLCRDKLENYFTKENIIEIVDAAFKTDDEDLLKKAIHFIQLNVEDFQKDIAWKDYMKSNPDCSAKIMFMLMKS